MSVPHVEVVHRFAQIPEAMLYDPGIDDGMVRVYGVLLRHGQDPANCYPSHRRIAGLTGKSKRTIPAIIARLADSGWIDVVHRTTETGDPDSNAYRVHLVCPSQGGPLTREVYASERRGSTRERVEGYTRQRAPNESNGEREQEEREPPLPPRSSFRVASDDVGRLWVSEVGS